MFATRRGRETLERYFGRSRARGDRLPESLAAWVTHELKAATDESGLATPRRPFVIGRKGSRLVVTLVENGESHFLLLQERTDEIDPSSLATLGLTRRQCEVLAWVARGKTNQEIGSILGSRASTVKKHLERIYPKLGVETRTAAAIHALAVGLEPLQ
ncbi:MAG: response regulator transcription factor [Thermoanaerobaculia bacterium]